MDDIFKTHILSYYDDKTFLETFCYVSNDKLIQNRRKKILYTKMLENFNYIVQNFKEYMIGIIIKTNTGYTMNGEKTDIFLKDLMNHFLYKYNKRIYDIDKKYIEVKYVRHHFSIRNLELSNIRDYFNQTESNISSIGMESLDPVYRMIKLKKRYLIKNYPHAKALIY